MFDYQPTLRGDKLELRPLCADDSYPLYAVASDPLIWEQHPVPDRHERGVFKVFFDDALKSGGALVVIDTNSKLIIGSSRFHGYDKCRDEVEIGWTFLSRSYWGGACNSEVKQLMLKHAFMFVSKVIFIVGPENLRSQRAVEKIGAVQTGLRPDGNGLEGVVYTIISSDLDKFVT